MKILTAKEWEELFSTPLNGHLSNVSGATTYKGPTMEWAEVSYTIRLNISWPGILPLNTKTGDHCFGRWIANGTGLAMVAAGGAREYSISRDRLGDVDWYAQLLEKTWFYDPSDFLMAYKDAARWDNPHIGDDAVNKFINSMVLHAAERGETPFFPRSIAGKIYYIVDRMSDKELIAFCLFLEKNKTGI